MQRLLTLSGNKEKREGGAVRGMIMRRECYLDQLEDRNEESERERGRTRTMEPSSKREATTPKQPPRYQPPYQHQISSFQTPPTYTQSIGSEACLGRRFPHERPMKVPLFEKKI